MARSFWQCVKSDVFVGSLGVGSHMSTVKTSQLSMSLEEISLHDNCVLKTSW